MGNILSLFLPNNYINVPSPGKPNPIELPEPIVVKDRIFTNINHNKKGLIIGINYITNNIKNDDLNGCVNDMNNIKQFLKQQCFFSRGQIKLLENSNATAINIKKELNELVKYSKNNKGSEIWFSYSGHGASTHSFFEKVVHPIQVSA